MTVSILSGSLIGADAVLLCAPYGRGASYQSGAQNGPEFIVAAMAEQIEPFDRYLNMETARRFQIATSVIEGLDGVRPEDVVQTIEDRWLETAGFKLLLGGTHVVTIGALKAVAQRFDPNEVTILQIDAHADLRDDDGDYNDHDPSPYAHSCVMRRASELGFRIVTVGVRAYSREELEYATKARVTWFEWARGKHHSIGHILASIKTRYVYLSVDVDGFDPSVMPATGTPVPGGLSWEFGVDLILRVGTLFELIGADIVEVAPVAGSVVTEFSAAQLGYHILGLALGGSR